MTYKELAEKISKMSEKEKNLDVIVYNENATKCYNVISIQQLDEEEISGVLFPHPDNPVLWI